MDDATRPRDLPVAGRPVWPRWRKRRWYCPTPTCQRKSITEQVAQFLARSRLTSRLRLAAEVAVADAGRTVVQAARDHDVSWPVVATAFTAHANAVLPAEPEPVTVLGIDEVLYERCGAVFTQLRRHNCDTGAQLWPLGS